jgi:heme/copper-type cytochrome/quinol oxidase subunit 4
LAVLNFSVIVISCWQAYQARNIESEFSESYYIALAVASLFQVFLTGIPVVVVVRDAPEAFYIVLVIMLFPVSMAILSLIFVPKICMHRSYSGMSVSDNKKRVRQKALNGLKRRSDEFSNRHPSRIHSSSFEAEPAPASLEEQKYEESGAS